MKLKVFVTAISIFVSIFVSAQDAKSSTETFVASGKPVVVVYSNFSVDNSDGKNKTGFEIERAYLGYSYNFSKNFSGSIVYDVTNKQGQSPTSYTAFLKKACAEYSNGNLDISLGMISTTSFKFQETIWGKRYMYKSLQDEYGFESSADLGVTAKYKLLSNLSVDLSAFNGEGYKSVQADSAVKVAVGVTFEPVKNFFGRIYYDYMKRNVAQSTLNVFVAYKSKAASFGAEYDLQNNHKMVSDRNLSAVSLFGTVAVAKKLSVFGRFDNLMSEKIGASTAGWNAADGQVYIAGLEFVPVKGIQITPNIRYSDLAVGSSSTSFFVNLGVSL